MFARSAGATENVLLQRHELFPELCTKLPHGAFMSDPVFYAVKHAWVALLSNNQALPGPGHPHSRQGQGAVFTADNTIHNTMHYSGTPFAAYYYSIGFHWQLCSV
jgi:hypothetical protein